MKKALFVNDNSTLITSLERAYGDIATVCRCLSVEDVLEAIEDIDPDILFLDHNLENGGEGYRVVEILQENESSIEIYTTTFSGEVLSWYGEHGVEHIDIMSVHTIRGLITS